MKFLDVIAAVLLVIGGLNWGLIGLFDLNPISFIFDQFPIIARIVYGVVGLAAVYQIFEWKAIQNRWK